MKKLYVFVFLLAGFLFAANAQVLFTEDFSGGMPPAGWSIDDHAGNWSQNTSNNAGGIAPEARFSWSPQFNGESYLISPPTNTTGYTSLGFSFKQMVDHYGGAYTLSGCGYTFSRRRLDHSLGIE